MILKNQEGKQVYSDGYETEKEMLEIAKKYPEDLSEEYISQDSRYTVNNTFSSVRQNILNWYPFKDDCDILEIGAGMGAVTGLLSQKAKKVTAIEMNEVRADVIRNRYKDRKNLNVISQDINSWDDDFKYDYIVMIGVLEYAGIFTKTEKDGDNPFQFFLNNVKKHLKEDGVLLCAIENRFGLKYWCGASEDHIGEPFVGLEGYKKKNTPVTFSKKEIENLLCNIGFNFNRFYYILPDYKFPTMIYTDDYKPNPIEINKISFTYSRNSLLTLNEKDIYKDIIDNDVFNFFANSFLFEASLEELDKNPVCFVSARGESKKEYRINTIIKKNREIIKYPVHKNAFTHLQEIFKNMQVLKEKDISIVDIKYENNKILINFVDGIKGDSIFDKYLTENDLDSIKYLIDLLKINLLKSSDIQKNFNNNILIENGLNDDIDNFGIILKDGYIDMTFYNCFFKDNSLIFFDQEWVFANVPLNFILYYAIKSVYKRLNINTKINFSDLMEYINVNKEISNCYDKLENFIWGKILYRQTDFYGEDGYCNLYKDKFLIKEVLKNKEKEILDKEQILTNKSLHIELLLESERILNNKVYSLETELSNIYKSKSWNFLLYLKTIEKNIKIIKKILRYPRRIIKKISLKNISKFFKIYKKYSLTFALKKTLDLLTNKKTINLEKTYKLFDFDSNYDYKISDFKKLSFRKYDNPKISIIIPVYNQIIFTYNCLKSILENTSKDIEYEVIIANDCSTDLTSEIEKFVENIKVINNEKNLRFLLNCNNAAKYAKGKFLYFLNNDTQIQKNCIESLLNLIENDNNIGIAGSKLIYPNGILQEAGGIIWSDASAWNYGNRQDATKSEFNYVKEVDYISGASFMIRTDIWEKVGGFDEMFVPAYCEDSDLAFQVRSLGYKVVYQPESEVVHFEGISNGTDLEKGQKQYQVVNKEKFYKKWENILKENHYKNGENVFLARDRSFLKKTILVIDHYVPTYDKDAGSRTVYQYLKLFVEMGFNVKFIGDNFFKDEPYTTNLQQMGIEVLYGEYYRDNWQDWIKENAKYFDYVFLNRPHVAINYIDIIKKYTKAKIIYYGHDLHFLREFREYELTGNKKLLKNSNDWKEKEFFLMKKSDVILYPSQVEVDTIKKFNRNLNVHVLPAYILEPINSLKDFYNRKNLLFVGGFGHKPNVDGIIWFCENIFPIVLKDLPNIKLNIVGSNVPDQVLSLRNKNIDVLGFLSDEKLLEIYETSKVSIAPLRYGAGIKGKIVEAISNGLPVVTTSCGAEGLDNSSNFISVADSPEDFAKKILDLYENDEKIKKNIDLGFKFINENFSKFSAEKKIKEIFK